MASIGFDPSTGWWSVRYFAGEERGRIKKPLCKHPLPWTKARPPSSKRVPPEVRDLARPYEELERQARLGHSPLPTKTDLAAHVAAYIATYTTTHRANSVRILQTTTDRFLAHCRSRKVTTLQGVTSRVCAGWLAERLTQAKPSTVRTERAYLVTIWNQAKRHRFVPENPWDSATVDRPREEASPKFWTVEELQRLMGVLDGWILDWVVLDANTGLRASALLGLRWGDVSFPDNRLTVPPHLSKSGKLYAVPLTPAANEVLMRRWTAAKDNRRDASVFVNPATGQPYRRRTVQERIRVAVKRSGVRDFGHYCHAIRHSFAVALVGADVNIRVIQALLGHASVRTTEIYAKLAPGKAEDAMKGFEVSPPKPTNPPAAGS